MVVTRARWYCMGRGLDALSSLSPVPTTLTTIPALSQSQWNQLFYNSVIKLLLYRGYLGGAQREVVIAHSLPLNIIIAVVGWIYFAVWTISYYPQVRCMYSVSNLLYFSLY